MPTPHEHGRYLSCDVRSCNTSPEGFTATMEFLLSLSLGKLPIDERPAFIVLERSRIPLVLAIVMVILCSCVAAVVNHPKKVCVTDFSTVLINDLFVDQIYSPIFEGSDLFLSLKHKLPTDRVFTDVNLLRFVATASAGGCFNVIVCSHFRSTLQLKILAHDLNHQLSRNLFYGLLTGADEIHVPINKVGTREQEVAVFGFPMDAV